MCQESGHEVRHPDWQLLISAHALTDVAESCDTAGVGLRQVMDVADSGSALADGSECVPVNVARLTIDQTARRQHGAVALSTANRLRGNIFNDSCDDRPSPSVSNTPSALPEPAATALSMHRSPAQHACWKSPTCRKTNSEPAQERRPAGRTDR